MAFKDRRKCIKQGNSYIITLPSAIEKGESVTMAGHSLVLIDPMGEIPEDKLLELYQQNVEKAYWELKQQIDGDSIAKPSND